MINKTVLVVQSPLTSQNFSLDQFIQENIAYFEITLYILYSVIFLFGIFGNSVVIYVLMRSICVNRNKINLNANAGNRNAGNNNLHVPTRAGISQFNNSFKHLVKRDPSRTPDETNLETPIKKTKTTQNGDETQRDSRLNSPFMNSESTFTRFTTSIGKLIRKLFNEKLTVTNFYLLNLAISDFFYLSLIPVLVRTMISEKWLFSHYFCKIYFSLVYLCQCSSVFILVVLSFDRFLSVKYPMKTATFRSDEIARLIIFISWFLSFLFITPIALTTKIQNSTCSIEWPDSWNFANKTYFNKFIDSYLSPLHAFNIYTFLLNYLIPVSIIIILYTQILRRLNKKNKVNTIQKSKSRKKSHRRITKMVLAIIICYLVSWTPYWSTQVFLFVYQQILKRDSVLLMLTSHFVQVIAYLSSALNPFIYSYMSEAFRSDLKLALSSCSSCIFRSKSVRSEPKQNKPKSEQKLVVVNDSNNNTTHTLSSNASPNKSKLIVNLAEDARDNLISSVNSQAPDNPKNNLSLSSPKKLISVASSTGKLNTHLVSEKDDTYVSEDMPGGSLFDGLLIHYIDESCEPINREISNYDFEIETKSKDTENFKLHSSNTTVAKCDEQKLISSKMGECSNNNNNYKSSNQSNLKTKNEKLSKMPKKTIIYRPRSNISLEINFHGLNYSKEKMKELLNFK